MPRRCSGTSYMDFFLVELSQFHHSLTGGYDLARLVHKSPLSFLICILSRHAARV